MRTTRILQNEDVWNNLGGEICFRDMRDSSKVFLDLFISIIATEWYNLSVFCRCLLVIEANKEFGNTLQLSLRPFSVAPKLQSLCPACGISSQYIYVDPYV